MNDVNFKKWRSYKYKKPAARFEIVTSILSGDIVRVAGPFPAGRIHDVNVFRHEGLKQLLLDAGEKAVADSGYRGEPLVIDLPLEDIDSDLSIENKTRARNRHETCNGRIKNWGCCSQCFRHNLTTQQDCVTAVVVLTQYMIENGETLFEI